jgi:hypothetical protein
MSNRQDLKCNRGVGAAQLAGQERTRDVDSELEMRKEDRWRVSWKKCVGLITLEVVLKRRRCDGSSGKTTLWDPGGPSTGVERLIQMWAGNTGRNALVPLTDMVIHVSVNRTRMVVRDTDTHLRGPNFEWDVIGHLWAAPFLRQDKKVRPTFVRRGLFPRALVVSPERTAGQTACPEGCPARARKVCGEPRN